MKNCEKCGCEGRVERIAGEGETRRAVYVCPNPRCPNHRRAFAEEALPESPAGKGA